jgi:hypothetical protein
MLACFGGFNSVISDDIVVSNTLSVYFSDRNVVLKLALLQVSVSISNLVC